MDKNQFSFAEVDFALDLICPEKLSSEIEDLQLVFQGGGLGDTIL
jgi:hypothetical protein